MQGEFRAWDYSSVYDSEMYSPADGGLWYLVSDVDVEIDSLRAQLVERDRTIAELSRVEAENYGVLIEEMKYAWNPSPATFVRFEELEAFIRSMGVHKVASSLRSEYEREIDEARIFFMAALEEKQKQLDAALTETARLGDELSRFRNDVVTVLGRGRLEDQLRVNCRLNSYSESDRGELLVCGIIEDEAAWIRNRKR